MEKFRHSPEGRTESVGEKLRQILSASMRIYQKGEDTRARRKEIVLDYLNAVPLGGRPPWGEVLGLGDGLWVWYGLDFAETIRLLRTAGDDEGEILARGAAYKAVLSLLIALRRPAALLGTSTDRLEILTERYLDLLAGARIIDGRLRDAAAASRLAFSGIVPALAQDSPASRKGIDAVRSHLATMLGAYRRYDVDRMHLAIDTTLDQKTEDAVRRALRGFANPVQARAAGLIGERLLARGDPAKVVYSFTLYEIRDAAFRLLVQTDSTDQPFDVNEGLKIDLGSTAKLRTLVTYLELVASLHSRLVDHDREALRATRIDPDDVLLHWAVDHLLHAKDRSRTAMLEAAMGRRYAASSAEAFFTGGGLHTFQNFRVEDDVRVVSVAEAFRESINLVFVRLLRDIALQHTHAANAGAPDLQGPSRAESLARFADFEGRVFIERFYRKYRGMTADDIETALMQRGNRTAPRAAVVFRSIAPRASFDEFTNFVDRWTAHGSAAPRRLDYDSLYASHAPGRMSLADRGYVANIHPLELAVASALRDDPSKSFARTALETEGARQDAYAWLFSGRNQAAQQRAIRTMLERDAFADIHRGWQRVGYPFDSLVPSLASALGAAADRPAALAELIGIILADGYRLPVARVERLRFAQGAPYETLVECHPRPSERVMDSAVAAVLRTALIDVVNRGTAARVRGLFAKSGDAPLVIGGKTGTGDHRHKIFDPGGALREARIVNRAATLVFFLGEDLFGTVTAYVTGAAAADFQFTSALPVQVLKTLEPTLRPLVAARQDDREKRRNVPTVPESNDLASRCPVECGAFRQR